MKLRIQIVDEQDNVVVQTEGVPWQPLQWKSAPGSPLIIKRGKNQDGIDNGEYHIFSITAQPLCTLVLGRSETPVQFQQPSLIVPTYHGSGATPYYGGPTPINSNLNPLGSNPNQLKETYGTK